jgi:hypothetical protein
MQSQSGIITHINKKQSQAINNRIVVLLKIMKSGKKKKNKSFPCSDEYQNRTRKT